MDRRRVEIEGRYVDQEGGVTVISVPIRELIETLDYNGYTVVQDSEVNLDYSDKIKFEELVEKYLKASWSEREEIYKNATKQ